MIKAVLAPYLLVLALVTVGKPFVEVPFLWHSSAHRVRKLELIPFGDLFTTVPWWGSITNIVFNVALFVPFGMLVAMLVAYQPHPVRRTVLIAGGVSLGIEVLQFIFRLGFTDIDDVILNVLGAWLGARLVCFHAVSKRMAMLVTGFLTFLVLGLLRVS